MPLLQLPALNKLSLTHPPPPPPATSSSSSHFPPIRAFARIDHQNPIFSPPPAVKERSLPPSTRPRKLLCRPTRGKYLEEDYLVVRGLPTVYFISPDPEKEAICAEGLIPLHMMRDILDNDMRGERLKSQHQLLHP